MRLRKKIITVNLIVWSSFLILILVVLYLLLLHITNIQSLYFYLILFFLFGMLGCILSSMFIYYLLLSPLEKLNKELASLNLNNAFTFFHVPVKGSDEIAFIIAKINHLLYIISTSHEQLEQRILDRTQELKQMNIMLQQKISKRKSFEYEHNKKNKNISQLGHYDNITLLPNRIYFNEILNKTIEDAKRHQKLLAILFINLDHFKNVNDLIGRQNADLLLKEMGNRFATILRSGDTLAHLGADEFVVLLNNIKHPKYAGPIAEKILHQCSHPIVVSTEELHITASIGICIYPNDGPSLEELEKNAESALSKSKLEGGNRYQYFTQEMNLIAHQHIKLETTIRNAIQNEKLILYYQPLLNVQSGRVKCVEALMRLEHPELGMLTPSKFIPFAEESGLIMPIGKWAIFEACQTCKVWQNEGYDFVSVAVNISAKQFYHQDIVKIVENALSRAKLSPRFLELELTETAVMENIESAILKLNDLREMGIKICIDDFGTGYTSINYLKKFPIHLLKIDQSFIKNIPNDQNDMAITNAIILLGHNLGLEVVAEGVETVEQMRYLVDQQCDYIQGYYFSRPLPAHKIIQLFSKN